MKTSSVESYSNQSTTSSSSPHVFGRRYNRPKSTPANRFRVTYADNVGHQRPKTASLVYQNCERLGAVERESVQQHKLKPHLPTRKDKASPWQAQLEFERLPPSKANLLIADGTQKPVHVAPGYILSRSKSKYQMIIRDKFFELQDEKARQNREQGQVDPEIEQMINNLKEQVSDLNLYLEEERMNHRDTKRKADDFLQDKVDEMKRDHKEAVRRLNDEHEELLANTVATHKQDMEEQCQSYDAVIAKHRTEMAFLQGAFESYKSQSSVENQNVLKDLKAKLEREHEENIQAHLRDLGKKLTNDKNAALASATREHKKALSNFEKQSNKELEALNRRFSNHAADIRKLKEIEGLKEELAEKYESICQKYEAIEKQLAYTKRECAEYPEEGYFVGHKFNCVSMKYRIETCYAPDPNSNLVVNERVQKYLLPGADIIYQLDMRARLSIFERDFDEKVEEVDSRYKSQMAELMEQNTELRKQYMRKCDQLFSLTAKSDREKKDQLLTSKEAMKALIQSRSNAYVSIAASDPKIKRSIPKERPCSAPSTRKEEYMASASAGETDEVLARREVPFVRPQSVLELSAVFDTQELNVLTDEELEHGLVAPPDH